MNDEYLWDKTGEPDPEIQQLEEILGTLRYQPKSLPLSVTQRRRYFPMLAIAATVLLALLATGFWLRVRTTSHPQKQQAFVPSPTPSVEKESAAAIANPPENVVPPIRKPRNPRSQSAASALRKREREEALAVKQQLMLALRLASEKLNLAQKKARIG